MSFKKMRLLEEDEYLRMKDKQIKEYDPELRTLTLLKSEIVDLLSNDSMDSNEKQKLLNRAQIRFDNLRNLQGEKPEQAQPIVDVKVEPPKVKPDAIEEEKPDAEQRVDVEEPKFSDTYITNRINSFDMKYQSRAQHLLQAIQKTNISFDDEMHPMIGDKTLTKSNFDDIINFLIVPVGRQPPGYVTFTNALTDNNIAFATTPPGTSPTILKVYS